MSMTALLQVLPAEAEVNKVLSYAVGAGALVILLLLLGALIAFGGGREHS